MNNNLPKITVITVTYNLIKNGRKEFFKQCVESVHNQTYPNIEHLIIDGASSDGTVEMLQEYADKGWIKYISEPDSGHWNAMNKGAKIATGKYITYLNSDDFYVDEDALKKCISQLEAQSEECFSVANVTLLKRDNSLFNEKIPEYQPSPKELFYRMQTYNHETLICPKSIYEKLGYHNEKYKTAIDYEFNIKLVLNNYKQIAVPVLMTAMRLGGATGHEDGSLSKASIENVCILLNDIYPWAHLTPGDVKKIYQSIFPKNYLEKILRQVSQLKLKNFNYQIFKQDIHSFLPNKQKYYLFSVLYIASKRKSENNVYYKFLGIPLLKVEKRNNSRKYKLFNILPLLKIKK